MHVHTEHCAACMFQGRLGPCMHVYMYTCTLHACMYAHNFLFIHASRLSVYACAWMQVYVCMLGYKCVCMYACMYVCMYNILYISCACPHRALCCLYVSRHDAYAHVVYVRVFVRACMCTYICNEHISHNAYIHTYIHTYMQTGAVAASSAIYSLSLFCRQCKLRRLSMEVFFRFSTLIQVYVCMYVCMYVYIYTHTYACMYIHMHIYIYTHIYIYIYTHKYI